MFQQIQYACRFKAGQYKDMIKTYGNTATPPNEEDQRYRCDDGDVGGIEGYDQFGPKTWQESGRYTSINGVVLGKMVQARAGDVERWRMVHAGVRDTINLKLRRLSDNAPPLAGLFARQMDDYVTRYCRSDTELDLPLIAADGLTMGKVQTRKSVVFQPGYRWDALVSFPSAGKYCLINDVKVSSTIDRSAPSARLLGVVDVAPGQASRPLQEVLIGAARALSARCRQQGQRGTAQRDEAEQLCATSGHRPQGSDRHPDADVQHRCRSPSRPSSRWTANLMPAIA